MNSLIGTKSFYKKTILIALPIIVQNAITAFVAMLDNIMVGQVGTEQMSGVAIIGNNGRSFGYRPYVRCGNYKSADVCI